MPSKRSIAGTLSAQQTRKLHASQKSWENPVLQVVMPIMHDSLVSGEHLLMLIGISLQYSPLSEQGKLPVEGGRRRYGLTLTSR
jgi:hypothetical protein